MRARAVHLTERQLWTIAKYVIENKGVLQDENGNFLKFRVSKKELAQEVSAQLTPLVINEYQVNKAILFHQTVCELIGQRPIVPPPQESVEEDKLKVEINSLKAKVKELTLKLEENIKLSHAHSVANANLKERLNQIKKLGTV